MVKYTLRPALESESTQIRDLINLVGINPTGLDWKRFIVAVNDDGVVISCGQIKPHGKEIHELASIATLPKFRRQGIARAIIEELLKDSMRPLYLMCIEHNGTMYEKFGFRALELDEMPTYFRRIRKVFDLANIVRKIGEGLLVMKLD